MEQLSAKSVEVKKRPIKVLQFGEGNFLRAFVDYMFDICNEKGLFDGSIVLAKPIEFGSLEQFKKQDNIYTVSLRGRVDGEPKVINRIVTSVADTVGVYEEYDRFMEYARLDTLKYIVSNTTEAGIVYDETDSLDARPPKTYPGKLTKFLYERFNAFKGATDKGLVILPVELIDDNGIELERCVNEFITLWKLPEDFRTWVKDACNFCSTLVDRIVTGYPRGHEEEIWQELGYEDRLVVTAEPFALWVIESKKDLSEELPFVKAGLPVIYTDNQKPYKQRKVRILNGAHTSFVLASYLCGNNIVRESMEDKLIRDFMNATIFDEVIPTLTLPKQDLLDFADAVIGRFNNPYVDHALLSIALNSVSKWKARCMPSFTEYIRLKGENPKHLTFSLAALMAFYSSEKLEGNALIGNRNGEEYKIMDDLAVLEFFRDYSGKSTEEFAKAFLAKESFWGQDLSALGDTYKLVCGYLDDIRTLGMRAAMEKNF
ncbi:tagaturonate reductase [Lachnospiraceae bacterium YSD2013]|nr:tagaturonate reductase [Lachnospiraceae bacterium YSD2013]